MYAQSVWIINIKLEVKSLDSIFLWYIHQISQNFVTQDVSISFTIANTLIAN